MALKFNANDKITLEHCKHDGTECKVVRIDLNKKLKFAQDLLEDKQYKRAFHALINAYRRTFDIEKKGCMPCTVLFRRIIINFTKTVSADLRYMIKGFYKQRQLKAIYQLSLLILEEMERTEEGV